MKSFDWQAARSALLQVSALEISDFLQSDRAVGVYGIGYFCHNSYGNVLLVANTDEYHDKSYREFVQRWGPYEEDHYRWEIGNWCFPAGIASKGPGQVSEQYSSGWAPYEKVIDGAMGDDDSPGLRLRDFCVETLRQLIRDGVFQDSIPHLGFTVMDVDDPDERGFLTKLEFDRFLGGSSHATRL